MNYMNYTDDACMALFTVEQKKILINSLHTFREDLILSPACNKLPPKKNNLSVYPNPVLSNRINIEFSSDIFSCQRNFIIHNGEGKVIKKGLIFNKGAIPLNGFPPGMYMITVIDNDEWLPAKRFIIPE